MSDIVQQPNNGSTEPVPALKNGDKRNPDGTFAVGYKGGPGRPVVSITSEIRKALTEVFYAPGLSNIEKKTALQLVIKAILKNGIVKEDQKALDKIWAYIDGMPKGSLDLGVDREGLAELTTFMKELSKPK